MIAPPHELATEGAYVIGNNSYLCEGVKFTRWG